MNEAIKLAIEKGGYPQVHLDLREDELLDAWTVQNPLFWQALGKALGWEKELVLHPQTASDEDWLNCEDPFVCCRTGEKPKPEWFYQALGYHKLILTGGDVEKFWKELLTSQQ